MRRDLRLVPSALAAWLVAGVAIGCRDGLAAAAAVAWVVALLAVLLRRRAAVVALVLVVSALVLTAAAAGQVRREPAQLADSDSAGSVTLELEVTGRVVDGRVAATADGAPILVFGDLPSLRIGDTIAATGGLERAEAGDDIAFLLFSREPCGS